MIERPFFLDATFELMAGRPPHPMLSRRDVMAGIIHGWNRARIVTRIDNECALKSLSHIGIEWHSSAKLSYTFDDVAQRFRTLMPDLDAESDIHGIMWNIENNRPTASSR